MAATSKPRLLIGMGTGRSGTKSLAGLLDAQPGTSVIHEHHLLPWEKDLAQMEAAIAAMRGRGGEVVGDVGMYWLPYVPAVLAMDPDARFVCLERPREEVVQSFMGWTKKNHWSEDNSGWRADPNWDSRFPKFPTRDKAEALGLYWDHYHLEAAALAIAHPDSVRVWPMAEALNDEAVQRNLLAFAGYGGEAVTQVGLIRNKMPIRKRVRRVLRGLLGLRP